MKFHQTTLENGLQVIAELSPSVHSVGMGYFVRTGSRDETAEVSGVSHFLEHMAFKGNETYSADDVNRIFDEVGAKYNASTSEEVTLYHAAVLPEYVPTTLNLLSVLIRPSLRQDDFDTEKKVILEEIGMYDDMPGFIAYDQAMSTYFAKHPLGQSILGSTESITALTSEQMRTYHQKNYRAGNIVLAVAGNYEWEKLLELVQRECSHWPAGGTERLLPKPHPEASVRGLLRPSSQQQHCMMMSPAPDGVDPLRFAAEILAVIVGDDTGSRMYWDLVGPGLVDSAEMNYNEYDGCGAWFTYFNGAPEETESNLSRIQKILESVNLDGVAAEELEQARNKVCSRIVLRGERPMGRLGSLGNNWLYRKEYRSLADDIAAIKSVTLDQIRELLAKYPLGTLTTITIGPREELLGVKAEKPPATA